ncbi:hypothetical protein [Comamonas sp. C11]|uniref:hypothetical protein n=1 Tax=Comamonas sp. C11 TaxID=2966554 RepID=UPI0021128383|nr:hypothetical protein [Comamonas sp. C11]UUC95487.1 hypothetical protein NOX35_09420 [Comamonas sp. C11]
MTYKLQVIPAAFVGRAWLDGAHMLAKACETSGGEITGEQLKLLLSRGERDLIRIDLDGKAVGWAVTRIDQLPNVRALHICELYAPGGHWLACSEQLAAMARANGCTEMRCSAKPAQVRLYQRHLPWEPIYTTLRMPI